EFADGVEGAHVAGGVGAGGLADGRLVDEGDIVQPVFSEQPVVLAGRFGGTAQLLEHGRVENILDQRGFAGTGDAGDAYQPAQRNRDRDILQVVGAHAFEQQPRRVFGDRLWPRRFDLQAPAQIAAGQRAGGAQLVRRAVEDDLAAVFAGAG